MTFEPALGEEFKFKAVPKKKSPPPVYDRNLPLLLHAWCSATQTVVDRAITRGKGHRIELRRLIAFLGVPVAMDVTMDFLPLEKIFGGVSKCPRDVL